MHTVLKMHDQPAVLKHHSRLLGFAVRYRLGRVVFVSIDGLLLHLLFIIYIINFNYISLYYYIIISFITHFYSLYCLPLFFTNFKLICYVI